MKKVCWNLLIIAIVVVFAGCGNQLIAAAKKGDVAAMQKLLDQGADINEGGLSGNCSGPPLAHAAYHCKPESVRYLVGKGADIEAVGVMMGGNHPLHLAAREDCVEAVRILLDAGADINAQSRFGSALAWAARDGNIKTVKYLIARGADVDDALTTLTQGGYDDGRALIEKYARPTAAAEPRLKKPAEPYVTKGGNIRNIPDFKSIPQVNDFAVVIGIESYQSLPSSDYSKSDAGIVKDYLKALGFPERNIEFITDERATKSSIEKTIEAWLPNRIKANSRVFIYYSGHGAPEPSKGEAYLVPYDGDPNYLVFTGYSLKRLYEKLGNLQVAEVIVMLDSCFSGSGGRSVLAKGARPLVMMATTGKLPSNIAVMTASHGSQISTSSAEKGHGVFTYYFLKAIQEGKKDLADIYETIKPQVEDEAKRLNVSQSPSLNPGSDKVRGRFSLRK